MNVSVTVTLYGTLRGSLIKMTAFNNAWDLLKNLSQFDEASDKANKIMMEKYNPEGMAGVSMDFATIPEYQKEYSQLVQSFM